MPLISLHKDSPQTIEGANIQQIVSWAGDGKLKDDSEAQGELRQYLALVESEKLELYVLQCLESDGDFKDSGFVLQDVVNEIGRRLGFKVENGRYRGKSGENGFDGLWNSKSSGSFVVETKTSAAYTIKLETMSRYRDALVEEGKIKPGASILFVVGRQDTLALEQQIRGSKLAWEIRIISTDALRQLMQVNLASVSEEVEAQIHHIFLPMEYTRVDPIVKMMFTTSEDKDEVEEFEGNEPTEGSKRKKDATPQAVMAEKRKKIAEAFAKDQNETTLIRRKIALFSDSSNSLRIAISVSKRYEESPSQQYWYSYLAPMRSFMEDADSAFMIYGCIDKNEAYAIPYKVMEGLYLHKTKEEIELSQYRFALD